MNHVEVRDQMELAALESDGLDRLMAGDTADAIAVAGHVAGCPGCLEELGRLQRTASLVRRALALGKSTQGDGPGSEARPSDPADGPELPPHLRELTLAFVQGFGVPRPIIAQAQAAAMVEPLPDAGPEPAAAPPLDARPLPRRRGFFRSAVWAASLAAAIVVSVVATSVLLGSSRPSDETADLTRLAAWSIDVARAPDARQVSLRSPSGSATAGLLAFVPSNGKLVVSAHDLAPAPAGREYRCWLETAGGRRVVGRMFFAGGIAYWVGPVSGLGALTPGTPFGITLVDTSGSAIDGEPVLIGTL